MNKKLAKMNILLIITLLATALITGLWYAYSCSVNPGLGSLPDHEYLAAMQAINKAILNPVFFAGFMGTLILLPISAWFSYSQPASPRFVLLLIASLAYAIGVFGVTIMGNVPLNETLAAVDLKAASLETIARERTNFEGPWNKFHQIRTLASLIALVLTIIACMNDAKVQ
jgi:uncharacterized membrane protein